MSKQYAVVPHPKLKREYKGRLVRTTRELKNGWGMIPLGAVATVSHQSPKGSELVFEPCDNGDIAFRVSTHGYTEAYEKAVKKYCELHDLTEDQYVELLGRMPSKDVFTGFLLDAILKRGHRATKAEIQSKLDSTKNKEN